MTSRRLQRGATSESILPSRRLSRNKASFPSSLFSPLSCVVSSSSSSPRSTFLSSPDKAVRHVAFEVVSAPVQAAERPRHPDMPQQSRFSPRRNATQTNRELSSHLLRPPWVSTTVQHLISRGKQRRHPCRRPQPFWERGGGSMQLPSHIYYTVDWARLSGFKSLVTKNSS